MHKENFPDNVNIVSTTRYIDGAASVGSYGNFNLGEHVGDEPDSVQYNRELISKIYKTPSTPRWIRQVHSNRCIDAISPSNICADASTTNQSGVVCAILTADCLPIFACDRHGERVGVAHAGWKGIASGVIESFIDSFDGAELAVHFGPAISQNAFEVGGDVYDAFTKKNKSLKESFISNGNKYQLDIYMAARIVLTGLGVGNISGGDSCTFMQKEKYFSYRRDGARSGRMAHLIWKS